MSSPDHRPYLRDTDLRTAEDVAKWMRQHLQDLCEGRALLMPSTSFGGAVRMRDRNALEIETVAILSHDLDEQLDRERRQACRRAARERFHMFAISARTFKHGSAACHEALCHALLGTRHHDGSLDTEPFSVWRTFADPLGAALSFRAAARAK